MENHHAINGKIHYKWPFSIAMLVHQRVAGIYLCLVVLAVPILKNDGVRQWEG